MSLGASLLNLTKQIVGCQFAITISIYIFPIPFQLRECRFSGRNVLISAKNAKLRNTKILLLKSVKS